MKPLKVVVIDDELNAIESIVTVLTNFCENIEIAGTASDAISGIELARKVKPDLIFLDIEMPDATGFDVAKSLKELPCLIVFVTAFEHYAIKAFKANAVDYILKPVSIDEIQNVIDKARQYFNLRNRPETITVSASTIPDKISIPTGKGMIFVEISSILYIEADGRYTTFHFNDREPVFVSRSLGDVEEMLKSHGFFRAHNSTLVNLQHVLSLNTKEGGYLELRNGARVALSRRRKEDFLKLFGNKE